MSLIPLRAGPLEMVFAAPNAFLRHVRIGDREVVRGIFGAVRDRNWGTVIPQVEDLEVNAGPDHFEIGFRAICREGDIDFTWLGSITGTADGTVRFEFDGEAATSFFKNRIGLCVLHPIAECAGAGCQVEQTDGTIIEGSFPRWISPHQPFKNIRSISHEVRRGLRARVRMEGEAFEMEDQRNWTDASYKTYSTPLEEPFPVGLAAGDRVRHEVTISLEGRVPTKIAKPKSSGPSRLRIAWDQPVRRAPVGLGMATHGGTLSPEGIEALKGLRLPHLRVEVSLSRDGWRDRLGEADHLAEKIGAKLEVAVTVSNEAEAEIDPLLAAVRNLRAGVGLWNFSHFDEKTLSRSWIDRIREKLDGNGEVTPLAAGTNAYFAELNRHRPDRDSPAHFSYSINPQVHAFDDLSLIETLDAQRATVQSAGQFSDRPVVISPVTLRPRFNPNATEGATPAEPETDERQTTAFAAAWTLGSLGRLLLCERLHALTYFETHGPRGVMSDDGVLYPVARVLAALPGFDFACDAESSRPLNFQALALRNQSGVNRLLVANFSDAAQTIVANAPGSSEDLTIGLPAWGLIVLVLPNS